MVYWLTSDWLTVVVLPLCFYDLMTILVKKLTVHLLTGLQTGVSGASVVFLLGNWFTILLTAVYIMFLSYVLTSYLELVVG